MSKTTGPLERHRYHQGQRLRSRDFNHLLAVEAEQRWWHNRALHDAYGVVRGLAVRVIRSSNEVEVAPGAAYDCYGRELLLLRARTVPAPALSEAPWKLLMRTGARNPCLLWTQQRVDFRDGVVLARARGGLPVRLDGRFRPNRAVPLVRPRIGHGATILSETAWAPWEGGVEVTIDTSAAGFSTRPCYFTSFQGPTLLWVPAQEGQEEVLNHYLFLHNHIRSSTPDTLTFRVAAVPLDKYSRHVGAKEGKFFVTMLSDELLDKLLKHALRSYGASWIGIEKLGGDHGAA